jgi:hypothetical protein
MEMAAMKQTLCLELNTELFQLEEFEQAEALSQARQGVIYTWKTVGKSNWLERGISIVDAIGLVIIPAALPNRIAMCDDEVEDEDEDEDEDE